MNMNTNLSSPAAALANQDDSAASLTQPRILIVDDVADNRDILSRRLVRRGFQILEACNGTEALEAVKTEKIDLILLDIMMPDILGTEVVRRIRETRTATELPIIMVSAKSGSDDVAESLELGANDYVVKPVDMTIVLARIKTQLKRSCEAADERASREIAEDAARDLQKAIIESSEQLQYTTSRLTSEKATRKLSEDQLKYMAYHDELTGMMNRSALLEAMDVILSDPEKVARDPVLIFIDLDRFKAVNDVHGHLFGDHLLVEVADRLRKLMGDQSLALARLGGDEFALLFLSEGDLNAAAELGQRIADGLSQPYIVGSIQLRIGASCGAAYTSVCGARSESLLRAADLAMYRAKGSGRDQIVIFDAGILEERLERSFVENGLLGAIENEEFEIYFQPMIDTVSQQISCFEALVRWNHPERGMIPPDNFISVAEDTGLINELGQWVLRNACEVAMTWPDHVRLAVNLSPAQFVNPDLVGMISGILQDTGLVTSRLELEITENCLMDAGDQNVNILQGLRDLGVTVAIDDFGTGYSSISYLQNFVFDKLKIDRRFVSDIESNPKSAAIIDAIVRLGAKIGISTTLEGVESEVQFKAAMLNGCDELQGFLFAAPMTADKATEFIAAYAKLERGETR